MSAATIAAHADWSTDPRKRWIAVARRNGATWHLAAPEPVGDLATFSARLLHRAQGGAVALGVDLPLGLPRAFVTRHALPGTFPTFLRSLNPAFLDVCETLDQAGPHRPFYPRRGLRGMTRAAHAEALDLEGAHELSRLCDRATAERPAGAPLFWTLGANQSGKAAISAWRDWLIPALNTQAPPRLWPFEGPFRSLLTPGTLAVAETYPAEALRHLGLRLPGSKRRQSDRATLAVPLAAAMTRLGAAPDPALQVQLQTGFGPHPDGEDQLDCILGVLAVINVLAGHRPDTPPADPWLTTWEGWVLGQTAQPRA
jgi:hypothetical protein